VLATLRSVAPIENLTVAARLAYILTVWPWQARVLLDTRERLSRALSLFVVGAAASAVAAVLQFRYGISFGAGGVLNGRAVGLTAHANDQGGLLAIALCVAVGKIVYGRTGARAKVAVASLCGIGLVLSGSVSGMLAALVGVAVLSLRKGISVTVILVGVSLFSVGWFAADTLTVASVDGKPMTPLERLSQATGGGRDDQNTVDTRFRTYRVAIAGIRENPWIGSGLDEQSGTTVLGLGAHNLLLLAWFQGGVLVLTAEVLALTTAARRAWRRPREADEVRETVIAAFAAGIAFSMTAPTFYNRYFWLPPLCLMLLDSWRRNSAQAPMQGEATSPVRSAGVARTGVGQ
jgi:hypothetical protein